jgi:hypothetical protein
MRAALVAAPGCGRVRVDGIRREEEDRRVAARAQQNRVAREALELSGHEIPADDALRVSVDHDEVEHLATRE